MLSRSSNNKKDLIICKKCRRKVEDGRVGKINATEILNKKHQIQELYYPFQISLRSLRL